MSIFSSQSVLANFEKICRIPRCSRQEEKIRAYLRNWAEQRDFAVRQDRVGNLLLIVPPTPGGEAAPTLVLQGHLDMVCEKTPESDHDFSRDPIRLHYDGEWLTAVDTTLGADNGIGLALALALAEDRVLPHPPLELLFTVDEETGLTGAGALEADFFVGRILLNLDSEEEGVFTIGCAGGRNCELLLPLDYEPWPDQHRLGVLRVGGLQGGHSGVDIHEQRGNANVLLARTLGILRKSADFRLLDLVGGSAHNAIPREAEARLAIKVGDFQGLKARLEVALTELTGAIEPEVFTPATTDQVVDLLLVAPDGVMARSKEVPGLVETSVNLATIRATAGQLALLFSQRSDRDSGLDWLTARLAALARLAGGRLGISSGYPGWQPEPDSALLARAKRIYRTEFGLEPRIEAIHAGLECGLIGAKNPGLEMLSLGPTVKNPHSPREKLHLPSLNRFCRFLAALLASYARSDGQGP